MRTSSNRYVYLSVILSEYKKESLIYFGWDHRVVMMATLPIFITFIFYFLFAITALLFKRWLPVFSQNIRYISLTDKSSSSRISSNDHQSHVKVPENSQRETEKSEGMFPSIKKSNGDNREDENLNKEKSKETSNSKNFTSGTGSDGSSDEEIGLLYDSLVFISLHVMCLAFAIHPIGTKSDQSMICGVLAWIHCGIVCVYMVMAGMGLAKIKMWIPPLMTIVNIILILDALVF